MEAIQKVLFVDSSSGYYRIRRYPLRDYSGPVDLGLNMVSIVGKAATPSILYLNREHGEEIEVEVVPVEATLDFRFEVRTGIDESLRNFL